MRGSLKVGKNFEVFTSVGENILYTLRVQDQQITDHRSVFMLFLMKLVE